MLHLFDLILMYTIRIKIIHFIWFINTEEREMNENKPLAQIVIEHNNNDGVFASSKQFCV